MILLLTNSSFFSCRSIFFALLYFPTFFTISLLDYQPYLLSMKFEFQKIHLSSLFFNWKRIFRSFKDCNSLSVQLIFSVCDSEKNYEVFFAKFGISIFLFIRIFAYVNCRFPPAAHLHTLMCVLPTVWFALLDCWVVEFSACFAAAAQSEAAMGAKDGDEDENVSGLIKFECFWVWFTCSGESDAAQVHRQQQNRRPLLHSSATQ